MNNERIVILGNGGAAIHAASAARISGYRGEIYIISDTDTPAFNPMLSPYYLKGVVTWEHCFPFGNEFYRKHDITCCFDDPIESLDAVNQQVVSAKGYRFPYDRCLIATGASPTVPPIPGLKDSPRSLPLRTPASVKNLEKAMLYARKIVVLGASLVGLKMAEILRKRDIEIILLDVVEQILPRSAHPSTAAILKTYFEEHGVDVRLSCAMEGMESTGEGIVCHFPESAIEEADFVVVCTGVNPNLYFINPDQVQIDQAILVDERLQASVQNLYAAGDVCQGTNLLSGRPEWFGTWGNACYQGRAAGQNMAGKETIYPGSIAENISPFFEWTYARLGDVHLQGGHVHHIAVGDPRQGGYFFLAFEGDVLIGANLINSTHLAGKLRRAIVQKLHWRDRMESADGLLLTPDNIEKTLSEITDGIRKTSFFL